MKITISPWIGVPLAMGAVLVACSLFSLWNQSEQETKPSFASSAAIADGEKSRDDMPDIGGGGTPCPLKLMASQKSSAVLPDSKKERIASNTSPSGNQNPANQNVMQASGMPGKRPAGAGASHQGDSSISVVATNPGTLNPSLTGGNQASGTMGVGGRSVVAQKNSTEGVVPVAIPAAFGDPSALGNLSESDKAQIAQIANDFTKTVQASGIAPNSPEYQQLWDTAAERADEYYRGQFGIPAFNAAQLSGRVAAQKN